MVVCDYGSGPSPALVRALQPDRPPLLVVDAHDPAPWAAVAPDLVTPNAGETFRLLGRSVPTSARVDAVRDAAAEILARTGAHQVVVTLDAEGAVLIDATGHPAPHDGAARCSTSRRAGRATRSSRR